MSTRDDDILRSFHLAPPLGETAVSASDVFLSLCELDEALLESVLAADEADVVRLENALGRELPADYRQWLLVAGEDWGRLRSSWAKHMPMGVTSWIKAIERRGRGVRGGVASIGATGRVLDDGVSQEQYLLHLETGAIGSDEHLEWVSTHELFVGEAMRTLPQALEHVARTTSIRPSYEHRPARKTPAPSVVAEIDRMLTASGHMRRHPLSGGRFYYYLASGCAAILTLHVHHHYHAKGPPDVTPWLELVLTAAPRYLRTGADRALLSAIPAETGSPFALIESIASQVA